MRLLEKIRRIFASNATYNQRSDAKLMKNAPWSGNYDRTNIPKDLYGGIAGKFRKH